MGEARHNNHHAWPDSARMGVYRGQSNWGFAFIRRLERTGLAWDVQTPETLPERAGLRAIGAGDGAAHASSLEARPAGG